MKVARRRPAISRSAMTITVCFSLYAGVVFFSSRWRRLSTRLEQLAADCHLEDCHLVRGDCCPSDASHTACQPVPTSQFSGATRHISVLSLEMTSKHRLRPDFRSRSAHMLFYYVLPVVMKSLFHGTGSVPMDVGHLLLLARLLGTLCPMTCGIQRFLRTVTGSH